MLRGTRFAATRVTADPEGDRTVSTIIAAPYPHTAVPRRLRRTEVHHATPALLRSADRLRPGAAGASRLPICLLRHDGILRRAQARHPCRSRGGCPGRPRGGKGDVQDRARTVHRGRQAARYRSEEEVRRPEFRTRTV